MNDRSSLRLTLSVSLFGLIVAFALAPTPAAQQPSPTRQPPPPSAKGPTAAEKYMNIQVLKDLPAADLHDTMLFMAASVGGNCEYCHVRTPAGEMAFEKDDKDTKKTARKMIQMVRTINTGNFEGDPTVNCATCHQGRREPSPLPPLAQMLSPEQRNRPPRAGGGPPPRPTETAEQVLDRFVVALGGQENLQRIAACVRRGTLTNRAGQTMPVVIEENASGQYRVAADGQPPINQAFDGKAAWTQAGSRVRDLDGIDLLDAGLRGELALLAQAKTRYANFQPRAYDTLDGHDVIVLVGRTSPDVNEVLFFDRASGLLLRRLVRLRTSMGRMPVQIDYADYRPVGDVKMPFDVRIDDWASITALKFAEASVVAAIDPSRFAKPAPPGGD